jgi:hypothetical protein
VERIVKKSRSFREADRWNAQQNLQLTPQERIRIARALRRRAYPGRVKDVRECHRPS